MNRLLKRAALLALIAVGSTATGGCALYGHAMRDVDAALQQGRPADALARLESVKAGARNEALYYLNKGVLLRMSGDLEGSIAAFEAAKPLVAFQEAASVTESAGRLALAEGTASYQPRPFERLQLHVLQALNQLQLGNWDGARVEALQIDLLLERAHDGAAPHGGDAFARYLSGIVFDGLGEDDDALIAYRKALAAYDRGAGVGAPVDLQERLLLLTRRLGLHDEYRQFAERFGPERVKAARELANRRGGELVLVALSGLVPARYQVSAVQPDPTSGKIYRLALPALRERGGAIERIVLRAAGEPVGRSEWVEDLSAAARKTLDAELPGLIARSVSRNVVKNVAANQAGKEHQGLELLVNFAAALLENADVRSWSTLPDSIHLLRVTLPPGEHALTAELIGGYRGGSVDLGTVRIDRDRPTVIGISR